MTFEEAVRETALDKRFTTDHMESHQRHLRQGIVMFTLMGIVASESETDAMKDLAKLRLHLVVMDEALALRKDPSRKIRPIKPDDFVPADVPLELAQMTAKREENLALIVTVELLVTSMLDQAAARAETKPFVMTNEQRELDKKKIDKLTDDSGIDELAYVLAAGTRDALSRKELSPEDVFKLTCRAVLSAQQLHNFDPKELVEKVSSQLLAM